MSIVLVAKTREEQFRTAARSKPFQISIIRKFRDKLGKFTRGGRGFVSTYCRVYNKLS